MELPPWRFPAEILAFLLRATDKKWGPDGQSGNYLQGGQEQWIFRIQWTVFVEHPVTGFCELFHSGPASIQFNLVSHKRTWSFLTSGCIGQKSAFPVKILEN